jgi:pimeloyl-ACP methyl ester carboxylesterase
MLELAEGRVAGYAFGDPDRPIDAVFLHATGFNARTYAQGLSLAGERLHVVALDQRGHGLSTLPADPAVLESWTPFSLDLIEMLEALYLTGPVVLAGHSMGGTVAVMSTPKLGARVKGLALFDPVFMRPPPGFDYRTSPLAAGAARRRRAFESKAAAIGAYTHRGAFKTWPDEAIADYVEDGFAPAPEGGVTLTCTPEWESGVFAGQKHDAFLPLEQARPPMIMLRAEHGSTCRQVDSGAFESHGNRRQETIAGSSHFLPMERPDLVAAALIEACA